MLFNLPFAFKMWNSCIAVCTANRTINKMLHIAFFCDICKRFTLSKFDLWTALKSLNAEDSIYIFSCAENGISIIEIALEHFHTQFGQFLSGRFIWVPGDY